MFESFEVEFRDSQGVWRAVKTGLTESEAQACATQYENWPIRIVKAVRIEIPLAKMDKDCQ